MKTILVPTDFSKNAHNACKYAIEIARETKAKIILLHAFETPVLYTEIPMTMQMDVIVFEKSAAAELKKYYRKINEIAKGVKIELMLQQGLASARIKETALEKKVDLIVLGTIGKGALEKLLLGSNTTRLIRNAPCPILVIPPKAKYAGLKKIVYATDLTVENLSHTATLIPFAKTFNSEILFLNINYPLITGDKQEDIQNISRVIKKNVKYPKISGYACMDENVSEGIKYFLKKNKADCLAMYTHHRGILESVFKRSITEKVAIHASVPLFVIHEKDFSEDISEFHYQKESV